MTATEANDILPAELRVYGCNSCGTRQTGTDAACWMCSGPVVAVVKPYVTSQYGSTPLGMQPEIIAARKAPPVLTDDPCGGGPIEVGA